MVTGQTHVIHRSNIKDFEFHVLQSLAKLSVSLALLWKHRFRFPAHILYLRSRPMVLKLMISTGRSRSGSIHCLPGYSMDTPWILHEYSMDTPWIPHGYPMGTPWVPHGYPMGTPWVPHQLHPFHKDPQGLGTPALRSDGSRHVLLRC